MKMYCLRNTWREKNGSVVRERALLHGKKLRAGIPNENKGMLVYFVVNAVLLTYI